MKNTILKCLTIISLFVLDIENAVAQNVINGAGGPNWRMGGNSNSTATGSTIFGTLFNESIYTYTNGAIRTKLNSTTATTINTFAGTNTSGFLLLSTNNLPSAGITPIYTKGAFSMLHLNGGSTTNGTLAVQEGGYRTWMNVGVTFTSNSDLAYIGHRQIGNGTDRTEMVIDWSDNSNTSGVGPDVCTFRFTSGSNPSASADLDGTANGGREVMRLNGGGNVGIGPRFSSTGNEPTSMLHLNSNDNTDAWLQISNQGVQPAGNGNYTGNDGLRIGILGQTAANQNGNAFIYNQENSHLIFSTNVATPTSMNATNERMRITSAAAPTNLPGGGYGNYPVYTGFGNDTRIGISLFTGTPVTRPLSLLHLGLNAGTATPALGTDGWRPWMEMGMFISSGSDHAFIGMKQRSAGPVLLDEFDAVVGWGDNQPASAPAGTGPDNLRFIFTANPLGPGASAPATNPNGVEAMRMVPTTSSVFVGIGDDNNNAYTNAGQPGNTLEINSTANVVGPANSGLRFTDLNSASGTTANPGSGVLSVDVNGDVIYVPGAVGGGFPFGGNCGNTNVMTNDFEIPMNNKNFTWSGQGTTGNNVGIGITGCNPNAKLQILQNSTNSGTRALDIQNVDPNGLGINLNVAGSGTSHTGFQSFVSGGSQNNTGIICTTSGSPTTAVVTSAAILKASAASGTNVGIDAAANSGLNILTTTNYGVKANASSAGVATNYGVNSFVDNGGTTSTNYGVNSIINNTGISATNFGMNSTVIAPGVGNIGIQAIAEGATTNFAGRFRASGGTGTSYAVFAQSLPTNAGGGPNYAGYFNGDVIFTAYFGPSDQMFKQQIDTISDALEIISQLQPKTFFYDTASYQQMGFSSKKQYGLIAQQVETVLPELIHMDQQPAITDSMGNIITPAISYKSLNYQAFIAILMKGMQEQEHKMDSLTQAIASMQSQINGCCSSNARTQNNITNQTDVTLTDAESVVLNQNVPNPFAEQTTITYNLPESVQKAQLLFYDATGKLIKSVDLTSRGKGQINVFANDLSNGIYSYALIVDGQIADTKQMVKTN